MDKEDSQLVYELAEKIFSSEVTKGKSDRSAYGIEHLAEWSIQTAREFVRVAKLRGLVKTRPGLFDILSEGVQ